METICAWADFAVGQRKYFAAAMARQVAETSITDVMSRFMCCGKMLNEKLSTNIFRPMSIKLKNLPGLEGLISIFEEDYFISTRTAESSLNSFAIAFASMPIS